MLLNLVVLSSVAFVGLHELNLFLFKDLSLSSHISIIYLPAFLRLLNILVLGSFFGTLATLIGGLLLLPLLNEMNLSGVANVLCSGLGPLIAILLFRLYGNRSVDPKITKDLLILGLIYSFANALVHHLVWLLMDPNSLIWQLQFFEMILGDINGVILGAFALKAIVKIPYIQKKIDQLDKL